MNDHFSHHWHALTVDAVASALDVSLKTGLAPAEAAARLETHGPNEIMRVGKRTLLRMFISQFTDFLVLVLIGACVVSALLGEFLDAGAILAIVVLNGILGFVQDHRAEKSLAKLRAMAAPRTVVVREGAEVIVETRELVPGDVVRLKMGDKVPADLRLTEAFNLQVDEAALTGESLAVEKEAATRCAEGAPLAERVNMAYAGTVATYGRGTGVVVATGMATELGKIATLVQEVEMENTPLQQRLEKVGKVLVWGCLGICAVVFGAGLLRGIPIQEMFLTAVSLAVAAIPEGLPAVVTITLALGVQRMVKRNALVRRLSSVETLGSTSVICSDKTGTLTENKMVIRRAYVNGREVLRSDSAAEMKELLEHALLCTTDFVGARAGGDFSFTGARSSPTQAAVVEAAMAAGVDPRELAARYEYEGEVAFDSSRKRMTTAWSGAGRRFAIVSGAPEVLLARSTALRENGRTAALSEEMRARLREANAALAGRGLRVIGVAARELGADTPIDDEVEAQLEFEGLLALEDPPRAEAYDAVKKCRMAHITPIMITGDHRETAAAVARDLGILEGHHTALTGGEVDVLSDEGLADALADARVFARVTPEHKLRIVRALKARSQVVAMTGDGVNDAPALKEADIGVAMGITGTDVSKESSDMILTDDNFATIVAAVEEGRAIYDNIKKAIHYLLSCNISELLIMFIAVLAGWPLPLLPIQILWVNLVTDGPPALALAVDPAARGLLRRPPRPKKAFLFDRFEMTLMPIQGIFLTISCLGAYYIVLHVFNESLDTARTIAFSVMTLSQKFHALNCRSQTRSFFGLGPLTNPWLLASFAFVMALHMAILYVPALQTIFHTVPLSWRDWEFMIVISALPLVGMEIFKLVRGLVLRARREPSDYFGIFPE